MSARELDLWYFVWPSGKHSVPMSISLAPGLNISKCKEKILKLENNSIAPSQAVLFPIPMDHPVPLSDLRATLGELSLSSLISPPVYATIESIVGTKPDPLHLHLILVNLGTPLDVVCWIHGADPLNTFNLSISRTQTVAFLLLQITTKLVSGSHPDLDLTFYKSSFSTGVNAEGQQLSHGEQTTLDDIFSDIPFSMAPCVIIRKTRSERKRHFDWDIVERATKQLKTAAPSSTTITLYHEFQGKPDTRFFDFRGPSIDPGKLPDGDLPPIEVLYEGFGEFLDTRRGIHLARASVDIDHEEVNNFVISMSRTFPRENARREVGLFHLNSIFRPVFGSRRPIAPSDVPTGIPRRNPPRSDGHYLYGPHSIPCFIVEFKNEDAETNVIPIVELATYYELMVGNVGSIAPDILRRSRLPILGVTIVGHAITFFALVFVGSVVYVPLTPSLWCLPIECGGSDRNQLYTAFSAASHLLARIELDAEALSTGEPPPVIQNPFFPQIHKLSGYNDPKSTFDFQITATLSKTLSRHVYTASSEWGTVVIKLARSYSPELHQFCADLGYAPKLYAIQKLPGGFVAVAMEYMRGEDLGSLRHRITAERRDKWIEELKELVEKIHEADFVHGDLRLPNILCVQEKLVLLDFDWGGTEGKASYPHRGLTAQLKQGRDMKDLRITKEDDKRVFAATLESIRDLVHVHCSP